MRFSQNAIFACGLANYLTVPAALDAPEVQAYFSINMTLHQAGQFSAEEMAAGLECLATLDLRERLEGVGVRCRILHGECDRIVPLGSAQFLAGRIAGAELEVLAGRGHALPFTAAEEIARSIASVLR